LKYSSTWHNNSVKRCCTI